jgi:two-component system phosphate regulon response regulator PhoB
MTKKKVLAVDDDRDILLLLRYNLEREGYECLTAESGQEGLEKARRQKPDLVILDVMLPERDGFEVCRMLKSEAATRAVRVLMLTAKSSETDIVVGLELGADDYLTKPFSPPVLLARVKALMRRREPEENPQATVVGSFSIDRERHEVRVESRAVSLTATEFNLLDLLASRPGKVFSRDELLNRAWSDACVADRTIDVHVRSLRKKLGKHASSIETVRGLGYRLQGESR